MDTLYRVGLSNAVSATALALVVACLGRILWRRPAVLHCLWLLVLVKLVAPPFYDMPIPWISVVSPAQESGPGTGVVVMEIEQKATPVSDDDNGGFGLEAASTIDFDSHLAEPSVAPTAFAATIDWQRLAGLIWIAGTVVTMALALGRIRRFQLLLREAEPADADTQEWVDELASDLGIDRSPSVWWVAGKIAPLIWSLSWRPRLILPRELWKSLDEHQRASLIVHELAHLRRGDHQLRFFELIVTSLYWWHPVLWWARRALRDVEEQCCDAWVVWALPDAVKSYADTLMETLDFLDPCDLAEPLLASGFGRVHHLRKRLTMIMTETPPRLLGLWGTLGTLALAVVLLPVNASLAQKPDEKTTEEKKEVRVVVTTDGVTSASSSAAATASGEGAEVVTNVVTATDGAEPGRFFVTVKTDDSEGDVASGSLHEAMAKLKSQIGEIAKKSPQTEDDKLRRKALEMAIKQLDAAAEKIEHHKERADKAKAAKEVRAIVIRRTEKEKEINPEKSAEIKKAAARVAELAHAVQAKQKELMEAQARLSKLTGGSHKTTFAIADPVQARVMYRDARLKELPSPGPLKPLTIERRYTVQRDDEPGEKRIEALEKKLERLLEEVASLKKHRAK